MAANSSGLSSAHVGERHRFPVIPVLSLNLWVGFINLQFGKPDATQTGRQITLTLDSRGVSLAVLRFLWHECKKEFLLGGNPRAWF